MVHDICRRLHNCMNRLDKQTQFCSIFSFMVPINTFLAKERRLLLVFVEKLFLLEILWTDIAKLWKWFDSTWKRNLPSPKDQWFHFFEQGNKFFKCLWKHTAMSFVAFGSSQRKLSCWKKLKTVLSYDLTW